MNERNLFVDTNILIYLIDDSKAYRNLAEILNNKRLYISVVSEIELLSF